MTGSVASVRVSCVNLATLLAWIKQALVGFPVADKTLLSAFITTFQALTLLILISLAIFVWPDTCSPTAGNNYNSQFRKLEIVQMNLKALCTSVAVAAIALIGAAAPASATTIFYDSYGVVNNQNVMIYYPGVSPGPYGSGQINMYEGGNLVATTWCVDVTHDLYGSGQWNVTNAVNNGGMSNVDNGGGTGQLLSWQTLGEMGALAAYGNLNINSDPNLSSAIQLAIWDVEYGNAISTVSSNPAVQALVAALVWDATTGRLGFVTDVAWLTYCVQGVCNQGQLEVLSDHGLIDLGNPFDTPEPSTLAIMFAALLGFGYFGMNRRGSKTS
jgi:hypothetical protein